MSEFSLAVFIAAVFLLAGGIKGVLGLGLPTVGMGLLSIVMTPVQAAGILVIPALVTNIWQVASGPALLSLLRRFALMIVATVIGTFSTVEFLTRSSAIHRHGCIGCSACGVWDLRACRTTVGNSPVLRTMAVTARWIRHRYFEWRNRRICHSYGSVPDVSSTRQRRTRADRRH